MTTNVFIDGGHGTTGIEIAERLAGRQELSLIALDLEDRRNAVARRDALNAADIVILCLPDDAARRSLLGTLLKHNRHSLSPAELDGDGLLRGPDPLCAPRHVPTALARLFVGLQLARELNVVEQLGAVVQVHIPPRL